MTKLDCNLKYDLWYKFIGSLNYSHFNSRLLLAFCVCINEENWLFSIFVFFKVELTMRADMSLNQINVTAK